MGKCLPLTHAWVLIECIGNIDTYKCTKCGATKTRVSSW